MGRRGTGTGRSAGGGRKKGLSKTLEAEIFAEIETLIGSSSIDQLDFEAIEAAARRQALALAARAVETRFNTDHSDHLGPSALCPCGRPARYGGRFPVSITSVLGEITIRRAYYHCGHCETGFFPRDRALGIEPSSLSPGVLRMVGAAAAVVSFRESSELISELAGLDISIKQVERSAERLGLEIAADENAHSEPESDAALPRTLYLGLDGTGIPMRSSELEGRSGKQPDGSARTREVKLCLVWSAESTNSEGVPERDAGSATFTAAIESAVANASEPSDFARRVEREARRRRFTEAERQVVLGDGAHWIWNLASWLFPDAIQIVDIFHALERISEAATAIWGVGSEWGTAWAKARHEELKAGQLDQLLGAFDAQRSASVEVPKLIRYIEDNRARMQYADFRARGLCVSTGIVEAGCKNVIGARLKRSGMHWTLRGANAIAALRCARLSGRFEDFWERRRLPMAA